MGKRYGRNQKRKHRDKIKLLEKKVENINSMPIHDLRIENFDTIFYEMVLDINNVFFENESMSTVRHIVYQEICKKAKEFIAIETRECFSGKIIRGTLKVVR